MDGRGRHARHDQRLVLARIARAADHLEVDIGGLGVVAVHRDGRVELHRPDVLVDPYARENLDELGGRHLPGRGPERMLHSRPEHLAGLSPAEAAGQERECREHGPGPNESHGGPASPARLANRRPRCSKFSN